MKKIFIAIAICGLLGSCKKVEEPVQEAFQLTETISKGKELATVKISNVQTEVALTGKITFNEDKVARVFPLAGGFVRQLFVEHMRRLDYLNIPRSQFHGQSIRRVVLRQVQV